MTPGVYNLSIYRGDTYRWQFKLWEDAAKTDPADLTGVTVKAEIRDKPGGAVVYATLACTLTMPNIIDVLLDADSSSLLSSRGSWDLQLTYTNGDVATVLAGTVSVVADVTDTNTTAPAVAAVAKVITG